MECETLHDYLREYALEHEHGIISVTNTNFMIESFKRGSAPTRITVETDTPVRKNEVQ